MVGTWRTVSGSLDPSVFARVLDRVPAEDSWMVGKLNAYWAAWLSTFGQDDAVEAPGRKAIALLRAYGDSSELAYILRILCQHTANKGDLQTATEYLRESFKISRRLRAPFGLGHCAVLAAGIALKQGKNDQAWSHALHGFPWIMDSSFRIFLTTFAGTLAAMFAAAGERERTGALLKVAIEGAKAMDYPLTIWPGLVPVCLVAEDSEVATRFYGYSLANVRRHFPYVEKQTSFRKGIEQITEYLIHAVGKARFHELLAEGEQMTREKAISIAHEITAPFPDLE